MIDIRVLGPLEVTVDGVRIDLGGPRQRCVLARLIAARGQVVSADRLIEDLYADEAPPRALAAIQAYVSHLRRALEPGRAARAHAEVLITSPPGYALRLGPAAVDAWSFEQVARQPAGLGDPAATHARLAAAIASWRGTAFEEFGGMSWADLEAARLEELRLTAIERLAATALQLGRPTQVIADLTRLTAEHPLREESWRLLAVALYQSGRQGDALAALRRARAHLAEELGVDPGPALRQVEDDILAQAPALSAPPPGASRPRLLGADTPVPRADDPGPAAPEQVVGRDAELAIVMRLADQAAAGRIGIALVAGDAGAGKTALADTVSQRLAARGWTVTTGRCPEHEGSPAGWPWAEALRRLARAAAPAEPQALAALLSDDPPPEGDVAAARFRLHRAAAGYLEAVSRSSPLLVVLDDVHRADGETLSILQSITMHLTTASVLVLASYRPAEVTEQLADCLAALAGQEPSRLTLGGLDPAAAGELIRATCTGPVDSDTARVITERTAGNPFFIKETARLLDSEGALAATTEVPAGVSDVLRRRIARLPAIAQTVLRQAAVIGTEIDSDVLADIADVDENVLMDAIEAGLLAGLVTEPGPGRICFTHALIRQTLYQSLSRLRRARLHARAAAAIEKHTPREVAPLAYHFTEAGTEPLKAARYCRLAAEQAEQRFAHHEAAKLWEQAIACLDMAGDAAVRDRLEMVLGLVRVLSYSGQVARARSLRKDAIRAALPLDDATLLARVITAFDVPRAVMFEEYGTVDDELVGTVEHTLAALPPGDSPLRCRLLIALALELQTSDPGRGSEAAAEAKEMAGRLGDPEILMMAIMGRFMQSFRPGELPERVGLAAEILALPGAPVTGTAVAHLGLMMAVCGSADFVTADRHADEAARMAAQYDLPTVAVLVTMYRAMRAALDGDMASAGELYQQAAGHLSRLGLREHAAVVSILTRAVLLLTQDQTAAIAADPDLLTVFPELYALGLAASGDVARATELATRSKPNRQNPRWLFRAAVRALLSIAIDDQDRAAAAYEELLPFASRPAGAESTLITLGPVAQVLGDLARYLGRPEADEHYRHALAIAEQAHAKPWREAATRALSEPGGTVRLQPV